MEEYRVSLEAIIRELKLGTAYLPTLPEDIMIVNHHVNRPGLPLMGFFGHFEQV